MKYVVGFVLVGKDKILLQLKNRGNSYIKGKLNGLGGKIEHGETITEAMKREFKEETGHDFNLKWHEFMELYYENGIELNVLYARVEENFFDAIEWASEDPNAEELFIVELDNLHTLNCVENLKHIIALILDN